MCFDRDAVGSENIARVCMGQLEHQKRPDKYKPDLLQVIKRGMPSPPGETPPALKAARA